MSNIKTTVRIEIAEAAQSVGFYENGFSKQKRHEFIQGMAALHDKTYRTIENFVDKKTHIKWWNALEGFQAAKDTDDNFASRQVQLKQKAMDRARISNKLVREHGRIANVLEEHTRNLIGIMEQSGGFIASQTRETPISKDGENVGIIQLSDLHGGETVNTSYNTFNFNVLSERLAELAANAKMIFKAAGINRVLIAGTGDLINSDRRMDEALENSYNRSASMFTLCDILQQFIIDLNRDFDIAVANVCGNESRVNEELAWSAKIVSDSYDFMIHHTLEILFKDSNTVEFIKMENPAECVIDCAGNNVLLMHGHAAGLARTAKCEKAVTDKVAQYQQMGVRIDYCLFGHIHSAFCSDLFSRSGGMPGANAYSQDGLGLRSRASQNIYIAKEAGGINAFKIDLQTSMFDSKPYPFRKDWEAYRKEPVKNTVSIIQSVLV